MEEKKKKRLMKVGLASLCLALSTPLIFAGCSTDPESVKGPQGEKGESAYEIAKRVTPDAVGDMTETEWINSLKGEKGDPGKDGAQGAKGNTGATGEAGASITKVDSEFCSYNGKPAIKFTFTMSKGEPLVSYAAVPSELNFFGSSNVYNDTLSVLSATQSKIFNKIPAAASGESNKFTVAQVKDKITNISDYNFYVSLGEFTEFYEIDGVRIGNTTYNAESKTSLSIGMNNFIEDSVYKIEGNELFVAAPVVFELGTDVENGNIQLFNNTGKDDADSVSADVEFNISISDENQITPSLSIAEAGGSILMDDTATTQQGGMPVYNVSLKNGTTPIVIDYKGKAVGDIIVTRIMEGTSVRYAIDSITEQNQEFTGYTAGWLTGEDWDNFTTTTRTCNIMVFQENGNILGTSYTTVATKAQDITITENLAASTSTITKAVKDSVYNKFENADGAEKYLTWEEVITEKTLGEEFTNYVAVATLPADIEVNSIGFAMASYSRPSEDPSEETTQTLMGYMTLADFAKDDIVKYSIGNNTFINQKAFYVENSKLYVAADLMESMGSIVDLLKINQSIIPLGDFTAKEKINLTNVPVSNAQNTVIKASDNADSDEYNVTLVNTEEYVQFTYEGAQANDKITIIEFEVEEETMAVKCVGSGIDVYTEANKVFFYESYGKDISKVTAKTRYYYVVTPQGVASLTLNITPSQSIN